MDCILAPFLYRKFALLRSATQSLYACRPQAIEIASRAHTKPGDLVQGADDIDAAARIYAVWHCGMGYFVDINVLGDLQARTLIGSQPFGTSYVKKMAQGPIQPWLQLRIRGQVAARIEPFRCLQPDGLTKSGIVIESTNRTQSILTKLGSVKAGVENRIRPPPLTITKWT